MNIKEQEYMLELDKYRSITQAAESLNITQPTLSIFLSNLEKREINISMAEEVLKDIISPNQKREVTPQVILEVVAEHYGISVSDIIGGKRNAEIVTPRQVVMYLCREITDTPYKAIGILLGNRDHSTIINGDGKVRKQLQANDGSLKNNIDIIRKKLSS